MPPQIGESKADIPYEACATGERDALFAALRKEPNIRYVDMPEGIRERYQYYTKAEIRKLLATGYAHPITPLNSAVYDYVSNYLVPDRVLGQK